MTPFLVNPAAALLAAVSLSLAVPPARSCGPFFPNCYVTSTFADQSVLPTLSFDAELQRLLRASQQASRRLAWNSQDEKTEGAAELAEAQVYLPLLTDYDRSDPPAALPAEFQLYAAGARAWHGGNRRAAAACWRQLLALPPERRRCRSVWAAYMLGEASRATDANAAWSYWEQARNLASAGFGDCRHLAAASWGESAQLALKAGDSVQALRLYWRQYEQGGHSALHSLQVALSRLFLTRPQPDTAQLTALAGDAELRGIVTAWFAARGGPYQIWNSAEQSHFGAWLTAIGKTPALSPDESDRWAWVAYSAGEWDAAQHFADRASADAPASEWVRALLLLRHGELDLAAVHLSHAARAFQPDSGDPSLVPASAGEPSGYRYDEDFSSEDPLSKLGGLRGCLALSRDQYVEALRLFRRAGHDVDAQFVADRILTLSELKTFVDQEAPTDDLLRGLLARRLARAGKFSEARPYYSETLRPVYDAYVQASEIGHDPAQPKPARADALWLAAQLLDRQGMELVGTALEPDFEVLDGQFEWAPVAAFRTEHVTYRDFPSVLNARWADLPVVPEPLAPRESELKRLRAPRAPAHRYHYRYQAAKLAMLAAAFSPDDDPKTANILATAGRWLANADPDAADFFYQALVVRCPHTELGREAAALHWLPKF